MAAAVFATGLVVFAYEAGQYLQRWRHIERREKTKQELLRCAQQDATFLAARHALDAFPIRQPYPLNEASKLINDLSPTVSSQETEPLFGSWAWIRHTVVLRDVPVGRIWEWMGQLGTYTNRPVWRVWKFSATTTRPGNADVTLVLESVTQPITTE